MTRSRIRLDEEPKNTRRKAHRIGRYSRAHPLAKVDGRTREAALMRRVRSDLTRHVGGSPNAVERVLIERAVILSLRVAQIDAKILADETLTLHDSQFALAWNNSLRRTLVALGIDGVAEKAPSLSEYLASQGHAA
jgi:hypothetical protein